MKLFVVVTFCLLICYIHVISSETSAKTKPAKEKPKPATRSSNDKTKDKPKANKKDPNNRPPPPPPPKGKKTPIVRTPFDKVLDKLSKCAATSTLTPSMAEVMQENFQQLQSDNKYNSLFQAAPHTAAFIKKTKEQNSKKFVERLSQALHADWSSPAWKSADEINTLFQPFRQQFVYTMMRFNCT